MKPKHFSSHLEVGFCTESPWFLLLWIVILSVCFLPMTTLIHKYQKCLYHMFFRSLCYSVSLLAQKNEGLTISENIYFFLLHNEWLLWYVVKSRDFTLCYCIWHKYNNLEKANQTCSFSLAIFVHPEVVSENFGNRSPIAKFSHELKTSKQHIVLSVEIPALRTSFKWK